MNCLVVPNETGSPMIPDYEVVLEACKRSRACKFMVDPGGTLKGIEGKE